MSLNGKETTPNEEEQSADDDAFEQKVKKTKDTRDRCVSVASVNDHDWSSSTNCVTDMLASRRHGIKASQRWMERAWDAATQLSTADSSPTSEKIREAAFLEGKAKRASAERLEERQAPRR